MSIRRVICFSSRSNVLIHLFNDLINYKNKVQNNSTKFDRMIYIFEMVVKVK